MTLPKSSVRQKKAVGLTHQDKNSAVDAVGQWIECSLSVTGSIPSQGTGLGCRPSPQQGVREGQPHIDVSLPLFLPPFPSL